MILATEDPRCDWVRVERIASGHHPGMRLESRAERDAVITLMAGRGARQADIATATGIGHNRVRQIIRCLTDSRVTLVDPAGVCAGCAGTWHRPGEWRGRGRVYCTRHAHAALAGSDRAGGAR